MRAPVTTHILDLVRGAPAAGVAVSLYEGADCIATGMTNDDGRIETWDNPLTVSPGKYRLEFAVAPWFDRQGETSFYEDVHVSFRISDLQVHYHVPLLLSPYGYSTYRGS